MKQNATCRRCRTSIGVYEPAIAVSEGVARRTSRVAEPDLGLSGEILYHLACYECAQHEPREHHVG